MPTQPEPDEDDGTAIPSAMPSTEETQYMVRRLARFADASGGQRDPWHNDQQALALRQSLGAASTRRERTDLMFELGRELLLAGDPDAADGMLNEFLTLSAEPGYGLTPERRATARALSALSAYLRCERVDRKLFDEQERFCFPISLGEQPEPDHPIWLAIERFRTSCSAGVADVEACWLLNLATMIAGVHPEGVPESWQVRTGDGDESGPSFAEVAAEAGVAVDSLAGGCLLEDLNNDGRLDVMTTSMDLRDQIRLFINIDGVRFADRTEVAGLVGLTGGVNLLQADYDNDGDTDVLVLRGGGLGRDGNQPNSLLRNDGHARFDDVTESAGLLTFHPVTAAAWADYDNDGDLDLFVGNESTQGDANACELFHNLGDGTFVDIAAVCGLEIYADVKGVAWGDFNDDGAIDLYLSLNGGANRLFRNDGAKHAGRATRRRGAATSREWVFTDVTQEANVAEPTASRSAGFVDYDNDGRLDLFVAGHAGSAADVAAGYLGQSSPTACSRLYHNQGDGTFADVTAQLGLDVAMLAQVVSFGDVNADGFPDLYAATGDVDLQAVVPNRLWINQAGERFIEATTAARVGHLKPSSAAAFADLDNDGDQDLYVVLGGWYSGDRWRNVLFQHQRTGETPWLKLRLVGDASNRSAIGAQLRIAIDTSTGRRVVHALVGPNVGFGASPLRREIQVADATAVPFIEVRWPTTGKRQRFHNVPLNNAYTIREDQDQLVP